MRAYKRSATLLLIGHFDFLWLFALDESQGRKNARSAEQRNLDVALQHVRDVGWRIAETVERSFPERVAREPEVPAFHFVDARQIEHAIS
jgi:hypothetical protein